MRLRAAPHLSPEALDALEQYPWPGNIRELRNVIERAIVLCAGTTILPLHLGLERPSRPSLIPAVSSTVTTLTQSMPLRSRIGDDERQRIVEALERCAGNQTQAAELLGMSRRTLVSRLNTYGILRPRKRP